MATLGETREVLDKVNIIQAETQELGNRLKVKIDPGSVLEGLIIGLSAFEDRNLYPGELIEAHNDMIFGGKDESQLRGLFIGALMVPYVLGEQGEQNV